MVTPLPAPPSIDEIVPGRLWLGNLASAIHSAPVLGITHIVSVCPDLPSAPPSLTDAPIYHICFPVEDTPLSDILTFLPSAVAFIQEALSDGGNVLVHCRMGISRSAAVLCAWLIQTRGLQPSAALDFLRVKRPIVSPNYGFMAQLDVFQSSRFSPPFLHKTWRRKVNTWLGYVADTLPILEGKLYLSSEFPKDLQQGESLLEELGSKCVLALEPMALPKLERVSVVRADLDGLSECVQSIQAGLKFGAVLVHCKIEARACIVVAAYLMATRRVGVSDALATLRHTLPLFEAGPNVRRRLHTFAASLSSTTSPEIPTTPLPPSSSSIVYAGPARPGEKEHLEENWRSPPGSAPPNSAHDNIMRSSQPTHDELTALSAHLLSESGIDIGAFGEVLKGLGRHGEVRA